MNHFYDKKQNKGPNKHYAKRKAWEYVNFAKRKPVMQYAKSAAQYSVVDHRADFDSDPVASNLTIRATINYM